MYNITKKSFWPWLSAMGAVAINYRGQGNKLLAVGCDIVRNGNIIVTVEPVQRRDGPEMIVRCLGDTHHPNFPEPPVQYCNTRKLKKVVRQAIASIEEYNQRYCLFQPQFNALRFETRDEWNNWLNIHKYKTIHLADMGQGDISIMVVHSTGEILDCDYHSKMYIGKFMHTKSLEAGVPINIWDGKKWDIYANLVPEKIVIF
jgi:hypothetical protein